MVYFVCRSEYEAPHGRRIVEFSDCADLVDWFKKHWVTREELVAFEPLIAQHPDLDPFDWQDQVIALREKAFGGTFSGLSEFLTPMLDRPSPENLSDVKRFIESFKGRYSEGSISIVDSAIQAHTNDDEIDIAWYLFDDAFAKRFPERTEFLLGKSFELPIQSDRGSWTPPVRVKTIESAEDATYCCFFSCEHGATITEIEGCYRLPTRLPDGGKWLAGQSVGAELNQYGGVNSEWPSDLILLRAFAFLAKGHALEEALKHFDEINAALAGWLPRIFSDHRIKTKNPRFLTGDLEMIREELPQLTVASPKAGERVSRNLWLKASGDSQFQFSPHMSQVLFTEVLTAYNDPHRRREYIRHWIFFDNLWASANRHLAESILRYGRGADVLGP